MTATQPPQETTTTIAWLFENSREVMFVIGADKRFKLVNPAFERETGWNEAEVIGQLARDFLHPDEDSDVDAHVARLRENGFSDNVSRVRTKDGAWRWYEGRAQLTDDGQVIGVMRDATHERERDAKLAEAERTTRMLCQAAGIGAWTYEPENDEVVWSPDMLALTGYAVGEISTMAQIAAILHPDDDVRVRAALMAGIIRGEPQSLEHRLKNKSGHWSHWRLTFRTEPRPCGEYALIGVHQDITELVEARDAAVRGEQQILQLIESSPFAVAMFDKQLRCMVVSESWRQAFSRSEDDPIGRPLAGVFPTAPKRLLGAQTRALAGEVVTSKEDRFTDGQGRKRWVRWEARPWRDDGWADMPGYERWSVRPRLFWEGASGATAHLTLGAMGEHRDGGALPGRTVPSGEAFRETQDTQRFDGGLIAEIPVEDLGKFHLRVSSVSQKHKHRFGDVREDDRHETLFGEASFATQAARTSWLAGVAIQSDVYRSKTFPAFDYTYTTPALFVQAEHGLREDLTLAASARWDVHSEYGSHPSPRLSVLYRPGPWTFRGTVGTGFYAPTPFVEEIDAAGLSRLAPLDGLKAETAESASIEAGWASGPVEANITLFGSNISDAVRLEDIGSPGADLVRLINAPGQTRTRGSELLLRYRWDEVSVTGSYVYVDATEPDPAGPGHRTVPLTPRHTAGLVAMWERHGKGRIGLEAYYTGEQDIEDNPYRSEGKPYLELGALAEVVVGNASVFLNLENLLNIRQTKYDPLVRPRRTPDGRWTVDAWAPTDGFVVNGGVRMKFGG